MPYKLESAGGKGYYVVSIETGKRHSKMPLPKGTAERQLAAMEIALKREEKRTPKGSK
jgi:hypothetical protein